MSHETSIEPNYIIDRQARKRRLLIGLATLLAGTVLAPAALGCSCVHVPKNSTAFRKASAVFIGEVVSITQSKLPESWDDDDTPSVVDVVTFKVERRWKGARSAEVNAWIDVRWSSCSGLTFRESEKYLVYADSYKGSLVIYWCEKASMASSVSREDVQKRVRQLESFWFRTKARLWWM